MTRRAWYLGIAGLMTLMVACLTVDPLFFNGRAVDGYDWDADPPDPELEGEIEPAHPSRVPPQARVEGILEVDGRDVHYVYAHRADAAATVFFSHGTTWHLGRYWERVEWLWERGLNVMIYDYPSYGLSTGDPDETTLYANAAAVLEILPTLPDYTEQRLVFYGYSLGGAPTLAMAARGVRGEGPRPDAVITEAAFCSVEALVQDGAFLDLPASFFSENRFDNCATIALLEDVPVMIIHGDADTFVVPRHADMLVESASGEVSLRIVEGAGHSFAPREGGETYWGWMLNFAINGV